MPAPLANFDGNAQLRVSADAATGAKVFPTILRPVGTGTPIIGITAPRKFVTESTNDQFIDVALGRPVLEGFKDICAFYQISVGELTDANGRYQYGIVGPDSSILDLALTWTQQGVQENDLIQLTDV